MPSHNLDKPNSLPHRHFLNRILTRLISSEYLLLRGHGLPYLFHAFFGLMFLFLSNYQIPECSSSEHTVHGERDSLLFVYYLFLEWWLPSVCGHSTDTRSVNEGAMLGNKINTLMVSSSHIFSGCTVDY